MEFEEGGSRADLVWWIAFIVFVVCLLYLDLFVSAPLKTRGSPLQQALMMSAAYVGMALLFCGVLWVWFGLTAAEEFLAGFLIEKSLSVDNLFVMIMTFKMFNIRKRQQKELLVWGIIGAIIMRAGFILTGSWILHHFWWAMYAFGLLLIVGAVKMVLSDDDDSSPPAVATCLRNWLPMHEESVLDDNHDSARFFVRGHNGKLLVTQQLACLIVIEVGDVIFAVDSIPAIFAVTNDPFIVFTSNIFAILGLRAMYFVISSVLGQVEWLQVGLAAILGFVGFKMLAADFIHIPTWFSLLFIVATLVIVCVAGGLKGQPKRSKGHGVSASMWRDTNESLLPV